ncbi:PEP/pyruvate-binding domain-containing protein [Abyssisolibacter fermentans]|uniref:PEP/pyruvate-binding domain-containing protein n=1 Tax=Abyssisolibacter fermentans TaxID=1766203 RepID=UPI000832AA60|nr:PEP/pyruvate-binding domain-containing protein [Abyssisolibacter fermentans]
MKYGNKCNYLIEMKKNNILVPKFSMLGYDFFIDFLKAVDTLETTQLLALQNAWIEEKFKVIKKKILEAPIPQEIIDRINEVCLGLKFPIAIRSSASIEDGTKQSGAGLYKSVLNVSKDVIVDKVREVLASLYDEKCILLAQGKEFYPEIYYMGIVFQEMINPEWSGVLFTADPITGDPSQIQLEMAKGLGDKIVSGLVETEFSYISKLENTNIGDLEKNTMINKLRNVAVNLENILGKQLDIEWAYSDANVYILQCRPITTIQPKPTIDKVKIFSISELGPKTYPFLGFLQRRYSKWLKKAKLFHACEKNKIKTHKWKLCVFNKELFTTLNFGSLLEDYESEFVFYTINGNTVYCDKICEVRDKIKKFIDTYNDNLYCVSFREILPNERSAISCIKGDGSVQIECISGRIYSLKSGTVAPTRYILDENGNITDVYIEEQDVYYYEEDILNMVLSGYKQKIDLSNEIITKICMATQKLYNELGSVAVEWWIWGDEPYVGDTSLLKSELQNKNNFIISEGKAKGNLFKLPAYENSLIEKLSIFNTISVANSDFDLDKIDVFLNLKEQLIKWSKDGDILLYCERPYLFLAPFKKFVSGFVFKKASNLCHLSLILREVGIPAISLEGQEVKETNGEYFELDAYKGDLKLVTRKRGQA